MADSSNTSNKLKKVIAHDPILVYEEQADGKRILRSIRVPGLKPVEMPEGSGVTVEIGPDSVGSAQIKDDTVELHDLSPSAREAMVNEFASDDDVKAQLGL